MRKALVVLALLASAVSADAVRDHRYGRQVRFVGIHPIPKAEGGGVCNIEAPHVHIYAANKLEYRDHHGDAYFVGDPVAYKYEGPKYAYRGAHPIHVDAVVGGEPDTVYCYLEGPHFHSFQPAADPDFKVVGDAYFYVGEPPHAFIEARPTFVGINAQYRPLVYTRPVVEVEPPSGWIGARAEFMAPTLAIEAPPPVVIDHRGRGRAVVGGGVVGGGMIGADVGVHVALPPPPSIHIGVGVGVSAGAGVGVSGGGHGRGHR